IVPFRHNDVEALEKRLKRVPEGAGKLVVLEGVYSMMGDVAPLKEMVRISKENGAMVLVDEAHSMGFIGEHGRGVAEAQGVIDDVDFIIGTFSKSVGTVGGFCVSNHPKFEILRLVSRPYVFTASLPPSVVATAAAAIPLRAPHLRPSHRNARHVRCGRACHRLHQLRIGQGTTAVRAFPQKVNGVTLAISWATGRTSGSTRAVAVLRRRGCLRLWSS